MPDLNFKRGLSTDNQPPIVDGQIIYHIDTSRFYLDVNKSRIEINANNAKKLMGAEFNAQTIEYNNNQISSSKSIVDYINNNFMKGRIEGETLILKNPKIISFTVQGHPFTAESNMTWLEWKDSIFYDSLIQIDVNDVFWKASGSSGNMLLVDATDIIRENGVYTVPKPDDCCFVIGTQILISLNGQTQSIETINPGDQVVSYNIKTGENYLTTVKKLVLNKNSTHMAKIKFDNGIIIEMTDYHPLYTINGWSSLTKPEYRKLIIGDIVKTNDGWSKIIDIELYQLNKPIITYTLDVRDSDEILEDCEIDDNFYANGIVVHNAACPT